MMPEMDGIEACEKIRTIKNLENTLIAFLTARKKTIQKLLVLMQVQMIILPNPLNQKFWLVR